MNGELTGSDFVLEALELEGVERLFGVIGEGNAHLLDRTNDSDVTFRQARHEQGAVSMADGYARATRGLAVCTLTHGPGVTNGATGIAAADRDGIPLVVLVGDTAVEGRKTSLQYLDHEAFAEPITVATERAETAATLPEILARAFDRARTRGGPVVVELPGDVQEGPAPDEPYRRPMRDRQRIRPDPDRVAEAAAVLADAESPVVLAGGGAVRSDCADRLAAFAERLGAPIATTFFGREILPESHPLVSGIGGTFMTPANDELLREADALLALGAQLSGKTTRYGELYDDVAVVQVDVDREAIGRHRPVDVEVVGDAGATLDALIDRIEPQPGRADAVRNRIASAPSPLPDSFTTGDGEIDPRELTVELAERVPEETIVTVDSGNNTGFPAAFHPLEDGGRMFVNGNFGTMGYALPAALGAKLAEPDRPVVCYTGDGSLLQVIQELETGVRLELPIVVAVLNDRSFGIIRHRQREEFGRETASDFDGPAFATVAEGLGARAATVREPDDLDVVDEFLSSDPSVPLVLDARTDPEVTRPGFPPY